ncbi:uncharacterized protein LOC133889338 [Phragmites australis]|uniref:uncharacterized protein LOC133889338 n=1 Tax=Phragmites australis TaxID=29695 RepID=UPI002D78DF1F|nr:uncharacterized protein LOC133889338 [Phragmites australis]
MPTQGEGGLAASAAAHARAEAAARARAAEQMAFEDAWKATNPDFTTPFASVEDAVSRLLPYHVFADYEEEEDCVDGGGATATEKSSAQEWEEVIDAKTKDLIAHFEKQVLTFNIINRERAEGIARGEERLMLEMALYDDERRQAERVRAAIVQEHREQQEAARKRLALAQAQAQAQAAGAWPLVQPSAAWQALAAAAAASGQGGSGEQALVQALVMQQQQEMMTAGTWQALAAAASRGDGGASGQALVQAVMMQHMQQQQKQKMIAAASRGEAATGGQALTPAVVMQQQHQEEEMMGDGAWRLQQLGRRQAYVAPCADGSSSRQAAAAPHQPAQEQASGSATGMMMPSPWRGSAERREQ